MMISILFLFFSVSAQRNLQWLLDDGYHGNLTCSHFWMIPIALPDKPIYEYLYMQGPKMSFDDAEIFCQTYVRPDSQLAVARDDTSWQYLMSRFGDLSFWWGFKQVVNNNEPSGGWNWIGNNTADAREVTFDDWGIWETFGGKQPDDGQLLNFSTHSQDCASFGYLKVVDFNCSDQRSPVCELPTSACFGKSDCISGMCKNEAGKCEVSGFGMYSDQTKATFCMECQAGYFRTDFGSTFCNPCTYGYISTLNQSRLCTPCDFGFYSSSYAATSCSQCPIGRTTLITGASSIETCSVCDTGYFPSNESTSLLCLPCGHGFFNPSTAAITKDACFECRPGKYSETNSSSSCSDCPASRYNPFFGKHSLDNCSFCSNHTAVSCPLGSPVPLVGKGLYRNLNNPGGIYPCIPPDSCLAAGNETTTCSSEYTGFMCAKCNTEHFRHSGNCVKCIPKYARWLIILFSCALFGYFVSKLSEHQSKIPPSLRMVLFWFQFLSLFPSLSNHWPTVLLDLLSFTSVFNLDIGYFGMGCEMMTAGYMFMQYMKLFLPIIFVVSIIVQHYAIQRYRKTNEKINPLRIIGSELFVMNFFCVQLFSTMFQIFNCIDAGNGRHVVAQEPSVICFSANWIAFVFFDSLFIILYLIVFPAHIWKEHIRYKKNGKNDVTELVLQPFINYYRAGFEKFEFVKIVFKLYFVLFRDVISVGNSTKISFLSLGILFVLWLESRLRPYETTSLNDLSLLWSIVCECVLVGNIVFSSDIIEVEQKNSFAIILVVLISIGVTFTAFQASLEVARKVLHNQDVKMKATQSPAGNSPTGHVKISAISVPATDLVTSDSTRTRAMQSSNPHVQMAQENPGGQLSSIPPTAPVLSIRPMPLSEPTTTSSNDRKIPYVTTFSRDQKSPSPPLSRKPLPVIPSAPAL